MPFFRSLLDLDMKELNVGNGFGEKIVGPKVDGLDCIIHGTRTGEKQNRDIDLLLVQPLQGFKSVHVRHVDVENNDVKIIRNLFQHLPSRLNGNDVMIEHIENFLDCNPNQGVIICYKNFRTHNHSTVNISITPRETTAVHPPDIFPDM